MFLSEVNDKLKVESNPKQLEWDMVEWCENHFHIIKDGKSYHASLIAADYTEKSFSIKVGKGIYNVAVQDEFDRLIAAMGLEKSSSNKVNDIKAPMPGLVLNILVSEGDVLKKGDSVLILEAMKMENVLKAPADITIKKILVTKGSTVEKNQVLIEL